MMKKSNKKKYNSSFIFRMIFDYTNDHKKFFYLKIKSWPILAVSKLFIHHRFIGQISNIIFKLFNEKYNNIYIDFFTRLRLDARNGITHCKSME